jgi:predicted CXXCH cytochrome family protein
MRARLAHVLVAALVASQPGWATSAKPKARRAEAANSSQDCVTCHVRWSAGFATAPGDSLLVAQPAGMQAASPEMCESCHDGSVMDSRVELFTGQGHRMGRPPPAGMAIPDHFPLDEAGNMRCSTCHSPHERPNSGGHGGASKFLRMSNEHSATCESCHEDKVDGEGLGNHPMGEVETLLPPRLRHDRPDPAADRRRITCQSCHAVHGAPAESLLVDSARTSALCLACHADKGHVGPAGPWPARAWPSAPAARSDAPPVIRSMALSFPRTCPGSGAGRERMRA